MLCALFLGLPVVVNRGYANIGATKSLYFLLITAIFLAVWIPMAIAGLCRRTRRLTVSPVDIPLILLAVTTTLSALLTRYPANVWLGRNSRLQGAAVLLLYVLLCFAVSNDLTELRPNAVTMRLWGVAFGLVAGIAALHALRVDPFGFLTDLVAEQHHLFITTIGNINFFSAYVCLCLPVVIGLFCCADTTKARGWWLTLSLLGGIAWVLTCSESFYLGLAAFLAVAPFFFFSDCRRLSRFCLCLAGVTTVAAVFYRIYAALPNPRYIPAAISAMLLGSPWVFLLIGGLAAVGMLFRRVTVSPGLLRWVYGGILTAAAVTVVALFWYANTHEDAPLREYLVFSDTWGNDRGYIYRLCVEVLGTFTLKDWLVGLGPETLSYAMEKMGVPFIDQAHSEYLQSLLTIGVLGLLAQLGMMVTATIAVLRRPRQPVALALFFGLIAYWAQGTLNIAQGCTSPLVYLYLAVIIAAYKHPTPSSSG